MGKEFSTFDSFVDDILSSEANLLRCELDYLLMQHIFNSIDLENLNDINDSIDFIYPDDSYMAA